MSVDCGAELASKRVLAYRNSLTATTGMAQLKKLPESIETRREKFPHLHARLENGVATGFIGSNLQHRAVFGVNYFSRPTTTTFPVGDNYKLWVCARPTYTDADRDRG